MAAAVDNRDSNVPVVLLGLVFGSSHYPLRLIERDRRAVVTNSFVKAHVARQPLFDHFVGDLLEMHGHVEAQRFGSLEVNDQLKFGWLDDREIGRLRAFENAARVNANLMIDFCKWRSVADQAARVDELAPIVYCGHCAAGCKRRKLSTLSGEISIAADVKGVSPSLDEVREGHVNVAFGAGIQDANLRPYSASSRLRVTDFKCGKRTAGIYERGDRGSFRNQVA